MFKVPVAVIINSNMLPPLPQFPGKVRRFASYARRYENQHIHTHTRRLRTQDRTHYNV